MQAEHKKCGRFAQKVTDTGRTNKLYQVGICSVSKIR